MPDKEFKIRMSPENLNLNTGSSNRRLYLLTSAAIAPMLMASSQAMAQSAITAAPGSSTSVAQAGSEFNITTTRLNAAGTTGFNQFTNFSLVSGDTANLHLPGSATQLFNIVRDNQIFIDGTLNSHFNSGEVGGHVIFASPDGVIVGADGVLNVGSLSLISPTLGFIDDNVSAGGFLSDANATALARGNIALSSSGVISIAGKINAPDGVVLASPGVTLTSSSVIKSDSAAVADMVFDAVVQTAGGFTPGGSLIERDGAVEIVAKSSDAFEGLVVAGGPYTAPTANVSVELNGQVNAKGIDVVAEAKASSEFDEESIIAGLNVAVDSSAYGFDVAIVEAEASSRIRVGGTASLTSSEGVSLRASTETDAKVDASSEGSMQPLSLAVTVAKVDAHAEAIVESGATISAAHEFTLEAKNLSTIENNAETVGNSNAGTVAFTFADIGSVAVIESGAAIIATDVSLTALNQNSFSTEASTTAGEQGVASLVFAFADTDSDAYAILGGDVGSSGAPVSSVSVEAASITTDNKVAATAKADNSSSEPPPPVAVSSTSPVLNQIAAFIGELTMESSEAAEQIEGAAPAKAKVAAATAINLADQYARASIEGATYTTDNDGLGTFGAGAAPEVYSADQVSVYAETRDAQIRLFAESEASAATEEDGSTNALTISGAITVGLFDYDTQAEIGEGSVIEAARVGVGAVSEKLFGFTLLDSLALPGGNVDEIYEFLDGLKSRSEDPAFGLPGDLFTTYAASSSDTEQNSAFAGNVSFTQIDQDTRAWIDSGAKVTATGSSAGADFSTQLASLDNGDDPDIERQVDWWLASSGKDQSDIIVSARSLAEGVHVTGKIDFTGASIKSGENAIGGSVGIVQQKTNTISGIADGAVIIADRVLELSALTTNRYITLTPTSGEGGGLTGVGLINVISIDNQTHASISNLARIEADIVDITALQNLTSWSVAAVAAQGEGVSIGVSGAVNLIDSDTQAFVGDNSAVDLDATAPSAPDPIPGDSGPSNKLIVRDLRVRSKTSGEAGTIAVAGSASSKAMNQGDDMLSYDNKVQNSGGAMNLQTSLDETQANSEDSVDSDDPADDDLLSMLDDATGTLTDQGGNAGGGSSGMQGAQQPKFGFAISGSATVSLNELKTLAYVDGANIEAQSDSANSSLTVEALTDTDQISVSGAAALAKGSQSSKFSAAISGAVAYQVSENQTDAAIRNSTISEIDDIDVRALNGGLRVGAALALSANVGRNQNSAAVAGSFSIAKVADSSDARVTGSTITTADADGFADHLDVDAYNRSTIGIGAGSVAYGGRVSAAGGLTYAEIANRENGNADGSGLAAYAGILDTTVTNFDLVNTRAINAAQTIGVGVVGSAAPGQSFAVSGSVVINVIDADAKAQIGGGSIITVDDTVNVISGGGDIALFDTMLAGDREAGREENEYEVAIGNSGDSAAANEGKLNFGSNTDTPTSFGAGAKAFALSGAVAFGRASAGFAISVNDIDSDRTAIVDGDATSIMAGNNLNVVSDNQTDILSLSVSGAASSGQFAGAGSVTVNLIDDDTVAQIGDATVTAASPTSVSAQNVTVSSKGSGEISSLAGSIALSSGGGAIGASVAVNEIAGSVNANITDTQITGATALKVQASTSDLANASDPGALIKSLAVAGSVSGGSLALSGSATANLIETDVSALIADSTTNNETGLFADVIANRKAQIQSIAGAVGVSGGGGAGIGVGVNRIKGNVSADVMGGSLTLNTLKIDAATRDVIETIGIGMGGGSSAGVAGSVVVNLMGTDVSSGISDGAMVLARNNVGVFALADSEIFAVAGALAIGGTAGVGLASAVNIVNGETTAEIDGGSTTVTAKALDAGQTLTVRNGVLGSSGFDETTSAMRGVAVNATALRQTDVGTGAASAGLSLGSVAIAVNAGVNVIGGKTQALITDATINPIANGDATARAGDVDVKASTHLSGEAISAGLAASGGVSAMGAAIADTYETQTIAKVSGATLGADILNINAFSSYTTDNKVFGAGAGLGGLAAGGIVTIFDATTRGQLIGGVINANSVNVNADMGADVEGLGLIVGVGGVGAAGAFNVLVNESLTEALIGKSDSEASVATQVNADNVDVTANTSTMIDGNSAAGGAGGFGGIAGTASVAISDSTTKARIANATINGSGQTEVHATDRLDIDANTVAAAIGGTFGAGAGVNVVVAKSKTDASVENSNITSGALVVDANGFTDIDLDTLAVAAGGTVGVSGSVSVIKLGGTIDSDAQGEIGSTLTGATSIAGDSSNTESNNALTTDERNLVASNAGYNVNNSALGAAQHRVTSNIAGSTISAGTVTVTSDANTGTKSTLGSANLGGVAALGAAVGFTNVDTAVSAGVDSSSVLNNAGTVTVAAKSADGVGGKNASDIEAFVGSAGLGVGLGAAIANAEVTSVVAANISGQINGANAGGLSVLAEDSTHVDADSTGASVGGLGAAGVVISRAEKIGSVTATMGHATNTIVNLSSASLTANSMGGARATAVGASAGIGASIQGTVAIAEETTAVRSEIVDDATLRLGGGLTVAATSKPDIYAQADGVSVAGGAGIGVSLAEARLGTDSRYATVNATIGDNVDIAMVTGVTQVVARMEGVGGPTSRTSEARATGAAGGLLLGAQASFAKAETKANVTAQVGSSAALPVGGLIVNASKNTNQFARSSGDAGGFVALGAADVETDAKGATLAQVKSDFINPTIGAIDLVMGQFEVNSITVETNIAEAKSGSGGVVGGAASDASVTSSTTTTTRVGTDGASAGADTLKARSVRLTSLHASNFSEMADSSQAGVGGKSGASAAVTLNNSSVVDIENDFKLAAGTIRILADSVTNRVGDAVSVSGGAGGLANVAAASGFITANQLSDVNIGSSVVFDTLDAFNFTLDNSDIRIDARSNMTIDDQVVQRAAGGLQFPSSKITFNSNVTDRVTIGANSDFDSDGGIYIGASPNGNVKARAATKSSAGIGVTDAQANSTINVEQSVNINSNAILNAQRDIRLNTGDTGFGGSPSAFNVDLTSDSLNSALIPASTSAGAVLNFTNNAQTTIASGASVNSVRDIAINASRGEVDLFAEGKATYKVELLVTTITKTDRSGTANNLGAGTVTINGTAEAGRLAYRRFKINSNGSIDPYLNPEDANHLRTGQTIDPAGEVRARINELTAIGTPEALSEASVLNDLLRFLRGDTGNSATANRTTGTITDQFGNPVAGAGGTPGSGSGVETGDPAAVSGAIQITDVTAASGNVEIDADVINGTGFLTANGGPIIEIINDSNADLIVGPLTIFDASLGVVRLTGSAQSLGAIGKSEVRMGERARVTIDNSPVSGRSDLYVTGDILNSNGLVDIDVLRGNLLQTARIGAGDLQIDVPDGGYFAILPNGLIALGPDPRTLFEQFIILQNLIYQNDASGGTAQSRADANIPILLGPNIVDGVANFRTPNDFAQFMTHYLANPDGTLSDLQLATATANAELNTTGGSARLGNLGRFGGSSPVVISLFNPGNVDNANALIPGFATFSKRYQPSNQFADVGINLAEIQPDLNNNIITLSAAEVLATLARRNEFAGQPYFASQLQAPSGLIDVAGVVGVSAKYIDIGGTVISGRPTDQSVRILQGADNYIQSQLNSFAPGTAPATIDLTSYLSVINGGDKRIAASFDVATNQIVIDNVNASGGGHIILNGQILNTTTQGQLQVRNGRGDIQIDNQTGFNLLVTDLDAGADSVGVIQITDTAQTSGGFPKTTFYVQAAGGAISKYETFQIGADYNTLSPVSVTGGNSTTFSPRPGIRYEWFEERELTRTTDLVGGQIYTATTIGDWVWADKDPRFGESVTFGSPSEAYFQQFLEGEHLGARRFNVVDTSDNNKPIVSYDFVAGYRLRRVQSVKADAPVGISFNGNAIGNVTINSDGDVAVAGTINNPTGLVTIGAFSDLGDVNTGVGDVKSILQRGNGRIIATSLVLNADGSIGQTGAELDGFISDNGNVTANGGQGVFLSLFGEGEVNLSNISSSFGDIDIFANSTRLNVHRITAFNGDVAVSNSGDIIQTSASGAAITGEDVNLFSLGGGINGGAGQTFKINSSVNDPSAANTSVSAIANGDIYLEETAGTLRISRIESVTGDVVLAALDGDITNAFDTAAVDENQVERLNAVIDALLLKTDDGSTNILGFENRVLNHYSLLNQIGDNATLNGGVVSLTAQQAEAFAIQYAAGNGLSLPSDRAALQAFAAANLNDIRDFVQAQYDDAFNFLDMELRTLGGDTDIQFVTKNAMGNVIATYSLDQALQNSLFDGANVQFVETLVVASSALENRLTSGLTWTQSELENQVSASALDDALSGVRPGDTLIQTPSTQVFNLQSSIFANNVVLMTGGSVGGSFTPIEIDLTAGGALSLDPFTRALLATASPGDIDILINGTSGSVDKFIISPANPVFVESSLLNANAVGDVFIGSNSVLTINNVIAGATSDIRIFGRDGVLTASTVAPGTPVITGGSAIIESAMGSIGTALRPIEIALSGALTRAGAETGIFIRDLNGDFNVGNIYSNGAVELYAPDGSLLSSIANDDLHIQGQSLVFRAAGAIGDPSRYLGVQVDDTTLTAVADAGGIWLRSPLNDLVIDTASATGAVDITAADGLTINNSVSAGGSLNLATAGGDFTMRAGAKAESLGGPATIAGRNINMAQMSSISSFGNLTLQALTGQSSLGMLTSGGLLGSMSVTGASLLADVTATDDISFVTGASTPINVSPNVAVESPSGAITFDAGSIFMGAGATIAALNEIAFNARSGDAIIGSLTTGFDGDRAIAIDAFGSILPASDMPVNLIAAGPNALIYLTANGDIGSITQDRAIIVDIPAVQAVSAFGDINIYGLRDLYAPILSAATGSLKIRVEGALSFGTIIGEPDISVRGRLSGDRMVFNNGTLASQEGIEIGILEVGQSVNLHAPEILVDILHTELTQAPLMMNVTGFDVSTSATRALMNIDAPLGIVIDDYFVTNSTINTTADSFMIVNGSVSGDLNLNTKSVKLVLDNARQQPRNGIDIQLFNTQPNFFLNQQSFDTFTNEFILFYLPGIRDTQFTGVAFDAVSIRRNQQLAPGSSLWSDSHRIISNKREGEESFDQQVDDLGDGSTNVITSIEGSGVNTNDSELGSE